MKSRVNYSGFIVASLGFFLTRFTVTLALYEEPVRFLLSGVIPLTLGLGLAAFGVALAVADVETATVRTVTVWAVIGAGTMFVLALLTLLGSGSGQLPALDTVRSRAYLSNFLIGGSVGGTLTGLYAARNRRHRTELTQQANRLEVLNRLLRHEVLNALNVIRGFTTQATTEDSDAVEIVQQRVDDIEETIQEVRYLAQGARHGSVPNASIDLLDQLRASIDTVEQRHPESVITLDTSQGAVAVTADDRLELLFNHLLEWLAVHSSEAAPDIDVSVRAVRNNVRVRISAPGECLTDREQALLETGEIPRFDDPTSGFELNIARLLIERYQAAIGTAVGDGTTTITLDLHRATTDKVGPRSLQADVSDIRPAVPQLVVILGAGLIAGVIWGVGSELFGGSVAGIGVFYGTASPVVGWITHQFHSIVFAFIYAGLLMVLPEAYQDRISAYIAVGLAWGLALWLGAAGVIAPVWLRLLGIPATIPFLTDYLLVAHVTWGVSLGLLTALGYEHVVPWLRDIDWPTVRREVGRN